MENMENKDGMKCSAGCDSMGNVGMQQSLHNKKTNCFVPPFLKKSSLLVSVERSSYL